VDELDGGLVGGPEVARDSPYAAKPGRTSFHHSEKTYADDQAGGHDDQRNGMEARPRSGPVLHPLIVSRRRPAAGSSGRATARVER